MNIFYLDHDTKECASYHCDKHVVKMILEYAQLMSTAHRVLDGDEYADDVGLYKETHKNHPSAVWARQNSNNYIWLYRLFCNLLEEYTLRYGRTHKTSCLKEPLYVLPCNITYGKEMLQPPQCMPNEYKVDRNSTAAYRNYYIGAKASIAKWKYQRPEWFVVNILV